MIQENILSEGKKIQFALSLLKHWYAYREGTALQLRVKVSNHSLFVGRQLQDEVKKLLPPQVGREVHLKVIRVHVEEEAAVVALVHSAREEESKLGALSESVTNNSRYSLYHLRGKEPLVDLLAHAVARPVFLQTL
jgi:hypothetical protein